MSSNNNGHGSNGNGQGGAMSGISPELLNSMPPELRAQLNSLQGLSGAPTNAANVANAFSGNAAFNAPDLVTQKGGKDYIFGMIEVPKEMHQVIPVLSWIYKMVGGRISATVGDLAYHGTIKTLKSPIFKGLKLSNRHLTGTAGAVEAAAAWAALLGQPLLGAIRDGKDYYDARVQLREEFSSIIGTYHISRNNSVMNTAFARANNGWLHDLKMTAGDLISYAPMIRDALQEQKKLFKKRAEQPQEVTPATQPNSDAEKAAAHAREDAKLREAQKDYDRRIKGGAPPELAESLRNRELNEFYSGKSSAHTPDAATPAPTGNSFDDRVNELFKGAIAPVWIYSTLANIASHYAKSFLGAGNDPRASNKVIAWDMIKQLKEQVGNTQEMNDDESPQFLMKKARYAQDIAAIFQKAETETGRPALKGGALENLMPAANLIADKIAHGTLDVYALVKLAGDNKVIRHNGSARSFIKLDELQETLTSMTVATNAAKTITKEEFYEIYFDPELAEKTMKENLRTMKGHERAFLVSLCPDNILLRAGMTKEAIASDRKTGREFFHATMAHCVLQLANKTDHELKDSGLSRPEIQELKDLAARVQAGDLKSLGDAVDKGPDSLIVAAVRKEKLGEQLAVAKDGGDGRKIWADTITNPNTASNIRKKIEEDAKVAATDPDGKSQDGQPHHKHTDKAPKDTRPYAAREEPHRGHKNVPDEGIVHR